MKKKIYKNTSVKKKKHTTIFEHSMANNLDIERYQIRVHYKLNQNQIIRVIHLRDTYLDKTYRLENVTTEKLNEIVRLNTQIVRIQYLLAPHNILRNYLSLPLLDYHYTWPQ